jgi:heme/copper-type cytochrome/quinol oxidase subunit 1
LSNLGVNITFFPIHFLGLAGIPRRNSDYPDFFFILECFASLGSIVSVFCANTREAPYQKNTVNIRDKGRQNAV